LDEDAVFKVKGVTGSPPPTGPRRSDHHAAGVRVRRGRVEVDLSALTVEDFAVA